MRLLVDGKPFPLGTVFSTLFSIGRILQKHDFPPEALSLLRRIHTRHLWEPSQVCEEITWYLELIQSGLMRDGVPEIGHPDSERLAYWLKVCIAFFSEYDILKGDSDPLAREKLARHFGGKVLQHDWQEILVQELKDVLSFVEPK